MGPDLGTRAAELVGAPIAVPMHYDTWPPIEQSADAFAPKGVEVRVMGVEEKLSL